MKVLSEVPVQEVPQEVPQVVKPGSFKQNARRGRFEQTDPAAAYIVVPAKVITVDEFYQKYLHVEGGNPLLPTEDDVVLKTVKFGQIRESEKTRRTFQHRNSNVYEPLVPTTTIKDLWYRICTEEGFIEAHNIAMQDRETLLQDVVDVLTK